ncbi:uncharacterized protein LOC106470136 [Limulus polyphemus]|uniref:Uncharacterized protein LOC106470136 n=1 Tax=Limulus polyphemus TaxID=6850 RepID=A0ABM1TEX2_LIMPO|nr:uncharacterized protein LOC106470136 [Limulus polyphemus]
MYMYRDCNIRPSGINSFSVNWCINTKLLRFIPLTPQITETFNQGLATTKQQNFSSTSLNRQKRQDEEYECPSPDGLFADPSTCRRFYICSGGYPFSQACPPSLYFDDIKKFCTFKSKQLTCGPVEMTPTEPPTPDPLEATKCDLSECQLPDCFCCSDGTRIPGDLSPEDTPQMILMSFDGGQNFLNFEKYRRVLNESRQNPNGCPIKATFFVSHEYTSYFYVQKFYSDGHEIAVNSISHREPEDWWSKASYENWTEEMVGQREILIKFANISRDSLLGIRAPYLKPGGNIMASMVFDYGFVYDSSIAVPMSNTPVWPYTLDHKIPHRCLSDKCPTHSFPGIWEIPMNTLFMEDGTGGQCFLADQCVLPNFEEDVFDFLMENFLRHYKTNRAPLGLFFRVNWFNEKVKIKALYKFIDHILATYSDAWFVTMQQALFWIRNPVPNSQLGSSYVPWICEKREPACNIPTTCALSFKGEGINDLRYMETCMSCPFQYPWVGNFEGSYRGKRIIEVTPKDEDIENNTRKKK